MKNEIKDNHIYLSVMIVMMIVSFFIGIAFETIIGPEEYTIQNLCHSCNDIYGTGIGYTSDLLITLDKIKENCGSTHITKKYNDEQWYIFKSIKKDGWEKFEYVPLEECIKGD